MMVICFDDVSMIFVMVKNHLEISGWVSCLPCLIVARWVSMPRFWALFCVLLLWVGPVLGTSGNGNMILQLFLDVNAAHVTSFVPLDDSSHILLYSSKMFIPKWPCVFRFPSFYTNMEMSKTPPWNIKSSDTNHDKFWPQLVPSSNTIKYHPSEGLVWHCPGHHLGVPLKHTKLQKQECKQTSSAHRKPRVWCLKCLKVAQDWDPFTSTYFNPQSSQWPLHRNLAIRPEQLTINKAFKGELGNLVGGWATPLKNIKVNGDDDINIPNWIEK